VANLTIALLQLQSGGADRDSNLARGLAACHAAAAMGADIALFPEMWSIGYTACPERNPGRQNWLDLAIDSDDPFVGAFRELAAELGIAIAITYLQAWPGGPRNALTLIDRHGSAVLTYAKVHTCAWDWEGTLTPGDDFPVVALDTAAGMVQVGAMICYDREFPEAARLLMLGGAEVILTPNSCLLEVNRIGQFRARAFENMAAVAMANYAAADVLAGIDGHGNRPNGHSIAFDGIVCDTTGAMRDMLLVEAGQLEQIALATLDLAALQAYRQREPADAFRRPQLYGPLNR
jgi:N-carbamoylputrescine amidase